ncbi:MAG: DNA-deoxyinosine glycosylase [Oscillospiraceae bacterium]
MEQNQDTYQHITHTFPPFYSSSSEILILGSFPSVKSREQGFYYGHPQNRFWKMLASVYGEQVPSDVTEKKALLERHGIALYDVIYSCDIIGSSDSSIKNVIPADIESIVQGSRVSKILLNGKTAEKFFRKYQKECFFEMISVLPSTSPANAAFSLEKLVQIWSRFLLDC